MKKVKMAVALAAILSTASAFASDNHVLCPVSHSFLTAKLKEATNLMNGGLGFNMWGSVVNRDGVVCAVARTGDTRGDQWPGSRVISAQKANTANAFSLPGFALSTANLWAATQPGGSLFGLQFSNPVDTKNAYRGPSKRYGKKNDPLVGKKIGGVNVFGGGLALYDQHGNLVGAIGVSGDTSCADHNIAWRTRDLMELDNVPAGVGAGNSDNIIFDVMDDAGSNPESMGGFGHVACGPDVQASNDDVVSNHPIGSNNI